jgi:hypothetical protein
MKQVIAAHPKMRCVSSARRQRCEDFASHPPTVRSSAEEFDVNIRSAYTSAIAAMGIACSTSAFAGTVFVHAAYVPAVAYAPPRALYYVPPQPPYVVPVVNSAPVTPGMPVVPVVPFVAVVPPPAPAKPLPYATVAVPVVAAPAYAVAPARSIVYAQPVAVMPGVVVTR